MKTKQTIYFLLIIVGAVIMATGNRWMQKEYALSLGIVLLMFGIYKSSQSWGRSGNDNNTEE
ncbi:MAG: hypothetical protein AAF361_10905 [Bacteroidota bacterium]